MSSFMPMAARNNGTIFDVFKDFPSKKRLTYHGFNGIINTDRLCLEKEARLCG